MYKHFLISTDGSEVGQRGVAQGLSLAKALGAQVTVVTVTEAFPVIPNGLGMGYPVSATMMADYREGQSEAAEAIFKTVREAAATADVAIATVHVPDAEPAEAIIKVAETRGCDLIVMASHGRRGLNRLMLGSKIAEVLGHTKISVLVVR